MLQLWLAWEEGYVVASKWVRVGIILAGDRLYYSFSCCYFGVRYFVRCCSCCVVVGGVGIIVAGSVLWVDILVVVCVVCCSTCVVWAVTMVGGFAIVVVVVCSLAWLVWVCVSTVGFAIFIGTVGVFVAWGAASFLGACQKTCEVYLVLPPSL